MAKAEIEATPEPTMMQLMAQLIAIQSKGQEVQQAQLKQTKRRSNDFGALRSPFNPRGDKDFPMPPLKCDIYAPWKMTPEIHSLDREEVELFNLLEPGDYTIEMADGAMQPVCAVGVRNANTQRLEKLSLMGPKDDQGMYTGLFTKEQKQQFPSLKSMLRQMLEQGGVDASGVLTMKEEVRRIHLAVDDPKHLPVSQGE